MTILCPTCPLCGGPPHQELLITWPDQAWCANDDCAALCWNAASSLDDNLMDSRAHIIPDLRAPS